MIRKLLEDHIKNNVPDNEIAVLLSGGVDSISVALSAHYAGKEVHGYSFHLDTHESYDFKKARELNKNSDTKITQNIKEDISSDDDIELSTPEQH